MDWIAKWEAAQRELKAASLAYYKVRSMPKDQRRILGAGDYADWLAAARHRFKTADVACFELRRARRDRATHGSRLQSTFLHSA